MLFFSLPCLVFISAVPLASSSIIYQPKEVALHVNNIPSKMEEVLEYQTSLSCMLLLRSSGLEKWAGLDIIYSDILKKKNVKVFCKVCFNVHYFQYQIQS